MPRTAHVLRWLAASILASAFAAPAVAAGDGWRNTLTPYLLGVSIEGKATLRDQTIGVDVPTAEVLNALDMAGMLRYRGENETFSINGDVSYMKLSDARTVSLGPQGGLSLAIDAEVEQLVVHVDAAWKFLALEEGYAEVYFGLRYTDITSRARFDLPGPIEPRRIESSDEFFDPVIGLRGDMPLNDRWLVKVQADVGGFGAGMDVTWVAFGAFEYRFSERLGLWLGYQGLGQQFKDAGNNGNLAMDVTYHGPVIGLGFSW